VVASAEGDVLILGNQKVDKPLRVYNFSVENTPSYFAGGSKLWVHNASCDISNLLDSVNKNWPSIDPNRLYKGTTTGRGSLRTRIDAKYKDDLAELGFGWQAHHIIPWTLKDNALLKRLNVDMNSLDNAIPLPCKAGSGSACSLHSGSHGNYSKAIEKQLDKIETMNIDDVAKKALVEKSITKVREALTKGNPPLRNTDVTDWDKVFENL